MVKQSTLDQYKRKIDQLERQKIPFKARPKKALEMLRSHYQAPRSFKNYVASILSAHKHGIIHLNKKVVDIYRKEIEVVEKQLRDNMDEQVMSDKQKENWLSRGEWLEVHKRMKRKGAFPETMSGHRDAQRHLLYLLYTKLPPQRNIYRTVYFTPTDAPNTLDLNQGIFTFRDHKTSDGSESTHYQLHLTSMDGIKSIIQEILRIREVLQLRKDVLLLNQCNRAMNQNIYKCELGHVFGKNIGSTQLRTMFLSELVDVKEDTTEKARKELAKMMGHSRQVQNFYVKQME